MNKKKLQCKSVPVKLCNTMPVKAAFKQIRWMFGKSEDELHITFNLPFEYQTELM